MLLKLVCVFIFSDLFSPSSHNTVLVGFTLLYIYRMKKMKSKILWMEKNKENWMLEDVVHKWIQKYIWVTKELDTNNDVERFFWGKVRNEESWKLHH